jgi:hypothetical protein
MAGRFILSAEEDFGAATGVGERGRDKLHPATSTQTTAGKHLVLRHAKRKPESVCEATENKSKTLYPPEWNYCGKVCPTPEHKPASTSYPGTPQLAQRRLAEDKLETQEIVD